MLRESVFCELLKGREQESKMIKKSNFNLVLLISLNLIITGIT